MTSPEVVFNIKPTYSFNSIDNKFSNKPKAKIIKGINGMFDYYGREEKRVINMFDYYTGDLNKNKTMNIVLENGKYATKEQIELRKKQYTKYLENSNLWRCVISFHNEYVDSHIELHELEQRIIKDVLPKFFFECGFKDVKNMSYQLALHDDTDNYHLHFSFIEKKPNYITKDNKIGYRRKIKFSQSNINFLKRQVLLSIEREKEFNPLVKETNIEIDNLKQYFKYGTKNYILKDKNDLILEENILRLGQLLKKGRDNDYQRVKYNSLDDEEIKKLTKSIKQYILNKKDMQEDYLNFYNSLNNINNYFENLNQRNNIKGKIDDRYIKSKEEYVDNYIYNAIVNYSLNKYSYKSKSSSKIKADDIIEEIVLKEYLKSKKNSKADIIKNYLTNATNETKFKNKYKIRNAIKNINNEMEEAQKEFSKMFYSNEYENH